MHEAQKYMSVNRNEEGQTNSKPFGVVLAFGASDGDGDDDDDDDALGSRDTAIEPPRVVLVAPVAAAGKRERKQKKKKCQPSQT